MPVIGESLFVNPRGGYQRRMSQSGTTVLPASVEDFRLYEAFSVKAVLIFVA